MFKTSISNFFRFRLALMLAIVAAAITGCNKSDDPGGGGPGPGFTPQSISFTLNGATIVITEGDLVEGINGSMGAENWAYSAGLHDVDGNWGWDFVLGNIVNSGMPSQAQFSAMFATGPREYVFDPQMEFGAAIFHYDEDGFPWATMCGPQNGSSFNITNFQSISAGPGVQSVRIQGTFTATLYNCLGEGQMDLTNGMFDLIYQNI